jgi:Tfp pilus assembly protein PilX
MSTHKQELGAVYLFIVIFAALLITIVTVSFTRLMITDQQQASTNDLSQSAYDSAQAGVEDGKRALLRYENICSTVTADPAADAAACAKAYSNVVGSGNCNQGLVNIIDPASLAAGEVSVEKNSSGGASLNQAYTCVIIQPQTIDYLGTLSANSSNIVPLKSTSAITSVEIQWYDNKNISNTNLDVSLLPLASIPISGTPASLHPPLYNQTAKGWGPDRPSIMRTQLMQFGPNFSLTDFDDTNSSSQSNANTLFLYPTGTKGLSNAKVDDDTFTGNDVRHTPVGSPLPVSCTGTVAAGGYACTVKLELPTPIGGGSPTAFLRLTPLYNAADYRVTLYNGVTPVKFDAVQPQIDSTGRASTLFRRVVSRVALIDTSFTFPESTINITGSLCKNFIVTNSAADYANSCTP